MTAPPDQEVPHRVGEGAVRVPLATAPTDRVSLDWWQRPSIAPTASLVVAHDAGDQLAIGEVARSWPARNVIAQLVAEPSNPHDRHAVMVLLDGYKVGYLPHGRDPRYTAIVKHLAVTQGPVRVRARITGDSDRSWGVIIDGHPQCFEPARHFCAGTRDVVVDVTPEHQHLIEDLVDVDQVAGLLRLTTHGMNTTVAVEVDAIVVGHLGDDVGHGYVRLIRAATVRGVAATCPATAVLGAHGRAALHLSLTDDPARLGDVCS